MIRLLEDEEDAEVADIFSREETVDNEKTEDLLLDGVGVTLANEACGDIPDPAALEGGAVQT